MGAFIRDDCIDRGKLATLIAMSEFLPNKFEVRIVAEDIEGDSVSSEYFTCGSREMNLEAATKRYDEIVAEQKERYK